MRATMHVAPALNLCTPRSLAVALLSLNASFLVLLSKATADNIIDGKNALKLLSVFVISSRELVRYAAS